MARAAKSESRALRVTKSNALPPQPASPRTTCRHNESIAYKNGIWPCANKRRVRKLRKLRKATVLIFFVDSSFIFACIMPPKPKFQEGNRELLSVF